MSDEIKNSGQSQQPQAEAKKEEKEKTPYQLYLEEKNEREKLQETLQGKDKEYQLGLINLNKEISALKSNLKKKDDEIEITKAKYWSDKESDYKEAVERRQNSEEGIIVSSLYDYLDKRTKEGEHLKKQNLFYI